MILEVLLPFHRIDRFFEESVISLSLSQDIAFKTILVDDRKDKKENILGILRSLKNFEVVETNGAEGYGEALKVGSKNLSSDMVALFNSDDLVHPLRFKNQVIQLEKYDLSICKLQKISKSGRNITSIAGGFNSKEYSPIYLALGSYGANASWCMRREWWDQHSFFDNQECLDWRIALQGFLNSNIGYIDEPLYYYRKHPGQVTGINNMSVDHYRPVYDVWCQFVQKFNLPALMEEDFRFIAMPWLSTSSCDYKSILRFSESILQLSYRYDKEIYENILKILKRRYLLSIRKSNKNDFISKCKLACRGASELPFLVSDVVKQVRY
jgi:hypothetical protein